MAFLGGASGRLLPAEVEHKLEYGILSFTGARSFLFYPNGDENRKREGDQHMLKPIVFTACILTAFAGTTSGQKKLETDTVKTSGGDLAITCIGHASLMFAWSGKIIDVDPVSSMTDYSVLPKADLILVTHDHGDHFDPKAIAAVRTPQTRVIVSASLEGKLDSGVVMKNGDAETFEGIRIEAVPAYNIVNKQPGGAPYHPKGAGNGYVLTFGNVRVYVAGDTENIPEMKALKNIDIAFLPMNLPFTMTPEMVADAAKMFRPKILYPYHYGNTDTSKLKTALGSETGIEIRIRQMQ
jgi:L-ascorbate metabolism protein UlaG (beta-lactamase superfamily)